MMKNNKLTEKIKDPDLKPLEVHIDKNHIIIINDILNRLKNEKPLSVNEFLRKLKDGGKKSLLYATLSDFLMMIERPSKVTYPDSKNIMTIGIGFNLKQGGAAAVIWEVDHVLEEKYFSAMQSEKGQPPGGLKDEQIDSLLYCSLVGVDNEKGYFKGLAEQLRDRLNHFGFADIQFKPHQLIALQSLAFNNPYKLIGEQLCKALNVFMANKDPMDVLLQIMECSNMLYDEEGTAIPDTHGLQHRRMREAGMFLGDPAAIHISYRQYKRIEAALATRDQIVVPKNGHPIYSQPYGENENNFHGEDDIIRKELIGSKGHLPVAIYYYGSRKGDPIIIKENEMDGVVFSGDADTTITVKPNCEWSYPYLAGGLGANHYKISNNAGHVFVHDLSGRGKITIDNKHTLQGIALATDDTGKNYQLDANGKKFDSETNGTFR